LEGICCDCAQAADFLPEGWVVILRVGKADNRSVEGEFFSPICWILVEPKSSENHKIGLARLMVAVEGGGKDMENKETILNAEGRQKVEMMLNDPEKLRLTAADLRAEADELEARAKAPDAPRAASMSCSGVGCILLGF
jgi:hypothetical protein